MLVGQPTNQITYQLNRCNLVENRLKPLAEKFAVISESEQIPIDQLLRCGAARFFVSFDKQYGSQRSRGQQSEVEELHRVVKQGGDWVHRVEVKS